MSRISAWINAARPRTLPLSLAGIFVGLSLSNAQGSAAPVTVIACLFTTICFQILSNLANDLGDGMKGTDNAERIGPTRAVQSGEISMRQMKIGVVVLGVLSLWHAVLHPTGGPLCNCSDHLHGWQKGLWVSRIWRCHGFLVFWCRRCEWY